MGIIHHGSYILWFEEARVAFLRDKGAFAMAGLEAINYPVLSLQVDYKKSLLFEDSVVVAVTGKLDGAKIHFTYEIQTKRFTDPVAFGKTTHVAMDMVTKKPIRLPKVLVQIFSES